MKKLFIVFILMFFVSTGLMAQTWTQQTSPVPSNGSLNSAWVVDNNVAWMCGAAGVVIRTTNGGTNWAYANTGLTGNDFYTVSAIDANTCVVGAGDGGIWRTTNGGTSWTFITLTPAAIFINVVHFFNSTLGFAQGDPVGTWRYYITTDAGATWVAGANAPTAVGSEAGWNNSYMALDTGHIWWGTNVSKILKGSLRGPYTSSPTTGVNSFGVAFNDINNGVGAMTDASNAPISTVLSVNGGSTWTVTGFTPLGTPLALKSVPGTGYMWMGTATNIYRSLNSGATWTSQLTMPTGATVAAMSMLNVNLGYAGTTGTAGGRIYKYSDNVGINTQNTEIPNTFSLEQNYPNPFNPTTEIKYSVPTAGNVTIKIYNSIGVEVMTVVNKNHTVGNFVETVDMTGFSSGIYFYSLTSANFKDTKKMILVK